VTKYATNEERTAEYLAKFNRELVLKKLVNSAKPVIFDVGANHGSSIIEFKEWWPSSTIHSFEPQHECWTKLNELSTIYKNSVFVNECAVGNTTEVNKIFYTNEISSGLSSFNKVNLKSKDSISIANIKKKSETENIIYGESFNHSRCVNVIKLSEYLEKHHIETVDLLKIDTQGHEPEVLEGLGSTLSKVNVVITELMFYDYYERSLSFSDIEKFLLPQGFKLFDISHIAKNPMNGRTDWVDLIYINQKMGG
jgi:FkbM family methyltransferase